MRNPIRGGTESYHRGPQGPTARRPLLGVIAPTVVTMRQHRHHEEQDQLQREIEPTTPVFRRTDPVEVMAGAD